MSLRNEVEKLIQIEREKIAARERKHDDYHSRQRERFAAIRPVLQELVDSIETGYIRARIDDDLARLDVGKNNDRCFETTSGGRFSQISGSALKPIRMGACFTKSPDFGLMRLSTTTALSYFILGVAARQSASLSFPMSRRPASILLLRLWRRLPFISTWQI
jgi:hypothetical protein